MPAIFNCLYFFENENHFLLEIKRNDLPENADLSDVYHWLRISKNLGTINKLFFKSMDSSQQIEERYFEEGFLKFNQEEATFIEKFNSAQHTLSIRDPKQLDEKLYTAILEYLETQKKGPES